MLFMSDIDPRIQRIDITYTDGLQLGSAHFEREQQPEDTSPAELAVGGLANMLSQAIYARVDNDPAYVAARNELAAIPRWRFMKRSRQQKIVSQLYSAAFFGSVQAVADKPVEIISADIATDVDNE